MKLASVIITYLLLFLFNFSFGQSMVTHSLLKEHEIAILDILTKDTINPLQTKLDGDVFKFGIAPFSNSKISILKNRNDIYIQPLGTGKLYQVKKDQAGSYQIKRIDSTYFNGANFNAINFFMNDTLFQYGGDGYWHIRGYVTYFSPKTHEWELYNANKLVVAFEDNNNNLAYQIDRNNKSLYISNAFSQVDFPFSLNIKSIDSVFKFDIQKHEWTTLGPTNPLLKSIIEDKGIFHFQMNDYCIIQNKLELFWVNFSNNTFGKLKSKNNGEFKETWLSLYTNNTKFHDAHFCLGNRLYLIKIDGKNNLSYLTFDIEKDAFDFGTQQPAYLPTNKLFLVLKNHLSEIILSLLFILAISILFYWLKSRNKKSILNKEVSNILNNHFFESLTVIEKQLIEVLYEHHLKAAFVSTKLINKIIGVQNKDIMTQNKNRSDYFLKINQKFKFATHKDLPLIIKTRDQLDKRQFNYGLQEAYINDLALLIKK